MDQGPDDADAFRPVRKSESRVARAKAAELPGPAAHGPSRSHLLRTAAAGGESRIDPYAPVPHGVGSSAAGGHFWLDLVIVYFEIASALSIAPTICFDRGSISDLKRPITSPLRPIRNFSKFHSTGPENFGCDVR